MIQNLRCNLVNPLEELEQNGDCAFFRPQGRITMAAAIQLVAQAIALARARRIPKLLVNTTGFEGMATPNVADRYFIMREFAAVAKGGVKIAFVVPAEMIEDKFGVLVGKNAGLTSDVFNNEAEAIAWLNASPQN